MARAGPYCLALEDFVPLPSCSASRKCRFAVVCNLRQRHSPYQTVPAGPRPGPAIEVVLRLIRSPHSAPAPVPRLPIRHPKTVCLQTTPSQSETNDCRRARSRPVLAYARRGGCRPPTASLPEPASGIDAERPRTTARQPCFKSKEPSAPPPLRFSPLQATPFASKNLRPANHVVPRVGVECAGWPSGDANAGVVWIAPWWQPVVSKCRTRNFPTGRKGAAALRTAAFFGRHRRADSPPRNRSAPLFPTLPVIARAAAARQTRACLTAPCRIKMVHAVPQCFGLQPTTL